jgi:hypothetical protein
VIEGPAEQAVAADEAGASDGASPLNCVLGGQREVGCGADTPSR